MKETPTPDTPDTPDTQEISVVALTQALKALPPDAIEDLLKRSGMVPTTLGMSAEQLQAIVATATAGSAKTMQQALRKENPNYPERSVFNPDGIFDDAGNVLPPKVKLRRETFFCHVRLGGELETAEEIELFNRFTEDRESRDGQWKAEIVRHGKHERLYVSVPAQTIDDRMNLLPMTTILQELLLGRESVNPVTMQKRIEELEAKVKSLQPAAVAAA